MLDKVYSPRETERKWSEKWQEKGLFMPPDENGKDPYTIVIPPPNITGALHMGHALNNTIQDILVRYKRMNGYAAYWVPGTDHGGIATQNVLEKKLKREGKTKEEMGREKFLKMMWEWYGECGNTILTQLKKLGCALDISAENVRFTMDGKRKKSVFAAFRELWEKGLIYRGERIINWCPRCKTALSDIEVEYSEEKSKLWHIHYPLENGEKGLVIATTRPETMLADTAVAVNPSDERYKDFIGKKLILPLSGRKIPVIGDESVEKDFGTGALKVTPGHDPLDFEIGERHGLEGLQVIDFDGRMTNCPEKYAGKKAIEARKDIVRDLEEAGYLVREEPYRHSVSSCYRCRNHIEPLISEQWFVKTAPLAAPAIKAAENGEISFHPESWKKPFLQWLGNIQDWCISRQIWWGHRIPVWYCLKCNEGRLETIIRKDGEGAEHVEILPGKRNGSIPLVSEDKPDKCPVCGGTAFVQDPDVLDTWFSSALWPFSVFGWPEKTRELERFYPTSTLVTGYEILYLWVARMVMSGYEHMGGKPFSDVYIHGTVRDRKGKKMSKSLGNVVDPLEMMDKYGTDAMRFSLTMNAIGGKDIQFSEEMIIGGRNFVNKVYNVMRFILMNMPEDGKCGNPDSSKYDLTDRWIFHRYNRAMGEYRRYMDGFDASNALNEIYSFVWDDFCDWYLELAKPRLRGPEKANVLSVMLKIFSGSLKAMHPFIPYVTEELYQSLKNGLENAGDFLINEEIEKYDPALEDESAEKEMSLVMDIVYKIRAIRSQFSVSPSLRIPALLSVDGDPDFLETVASNAERIKFLAGLSELRTDGAVRPPKSASAVSGPATIYVPLGEIIDIAREKARMARETEKAKKEIEYCDGKLSNGNFVKKAPAKEVEKIRVRKAEAEAKLAKLEELIKGLD